MIKMWSKDTAVYSLHYQCVVKTSARCQSCADRPFALLPGFDWSEAQVILSSCTGHKK